MFCSLPIHNLDKRASLSFLFIKSSVTASKQLRVHWRSSKILTLDDATIEQNCRVQYAATPSIVFFLKVSGALIFQNKKEVDIFGSASLPCSK